MIKAFIWSLSKITHSFIKIKVPEEKQEEQDFSQNLLKSKILSGGVQNRFLSTFSKETLQTIENLATITGDKKLLKYLTEVQLIDEDECYLNIIHQGRDKSIDKLIDLLQWNLLKKSPFARAGGAEGTAVSRCAFAGMMALNQHEEQCSYSNFIMMVDHLEMSMDLVDENATQNQKNKELMEELKTMGSIEPILERWEMASKMRIWLQEKRKDISNSIKKKADADQKKKEQDMKDSAQANEETKEKNGEDEEETIDTTSKKNEIKVESISQEEIMKREKEQLSILIERVREKAELLIKLETPPSWEQLDTSNNLITIDGYGKEGEEIVGGDLVSKIQRIRTIQESKGTITSYENLSNKDIFTSCASSVLATLQCSMNSKSILKAIETKYVNAMNRYCGLKIMGELSSCYMDDATKISCFNWFCSSLRKNTNVLAHYTDDLTGMGTYLLDKCRTAFFEIYTGISKQIRMTTDKATIEFLLNCLKWKIGATDHQYILKSGIIQTLKEGNGKIGKDKNPIKYSWGHEIKFSSDKDTEKRLSHTIMESLEFIMMACFSRILSDSEDMSMDAKKAGSSISMIQQAKSVVNSNITELLLASSFEIIFEQLTRYKNISTQIDPMDWKLFVKIRNEWRFMGANYMVKADVLFDDEMTQEDKLKQKQEDQTKLEEDEKKYKEEAEQNGANRDHLKEILERKKKQNIDIIDRLYDETVVLKILRLLEIFTAIALKSSQVHIFVMQVTGVSQVRTLANLLLYCNSRHGIITLKIFNNLLKIGIKQEILDDAFKEIQESLVGKEVFEIKTKVKFENCTFLQFCFNLLLRIRSSQWDKRKLENHGAYTISCEIVRMFRSILRTDIKSDWKAKIEAVFDSFLKDVNSYSFQDFEAIISLFEGGEYNGLSIGSFGVSDSGSKFITVGFVKHWYGLTSPDNQNNDNDNREIKQVEQEYSDKEDYILAIHYDEKHPERNDMFLAIPDQVKVIPTLDDNLNRYLLNKERLDMFLKEMGIDQEISEDTDTEVLTRRCIGMKILVEHIEHFGNEIAQLFNTDFRDNFIEYLLRECSQTNPKEKEMR